MAPQTEYVPRDYELDTARSSSSTAPGVFLKSKDPNFPCDFSFELLRSGLYRTTFTSATHPLPPHPSAPKPALQLGGSGAASQPQVTGTETTRHIAHGGITATVDWSDTPLVQVQFDGAAAPIHQDLPFRSYVADGRGVAHYTRFNRHTLHVGLGEKAAPMDLSNRHFVLSATDCFGYDVYRTDPMYKHIPLLINATPDGCVGVFSTAHARGTYSVGSEMDGLWGHFKVYRQDHGGLEEYVLVGRTIADVVRLFADLAGYPLRVPRWAFGYLAGGMKYSMLDEPRACDALLAFADKMKQHDIPCSGFQMSSGYTVAEQPPKTRNVFTWNYHRFPDPKAFVDEYHRRGIRLIANIKPYVLSNHPEYPKLVEAGALFTDPVTKKSAEARLWSAGGGESGVGGHIDFTSKAGFEWWYDGVKALRALGIDCMWNDNNEYTVPHDGWVCGLDHPAVLAADKERAAGSRAIGLWGRALQTELMGKSSHDAVLAVRPNERPFVLTRSATIGTMRYCSSSWSGDNVTSWDGMKGSNALSLSAGMCLLQCYGHDIGGFEGPQPSPELLVRWVQMGIYSSRFAINCYKTGDDNTVGDVIEPWMYPEATGLVRAAIKRRYELLPYIYSLHLESTARAVPPQRWVGWGYELDDPQVWCPELRGGETQFWLGDALLVGGVFQPGETSARMYLPRHKGDADVDAEFLNLNAPGQYLAAGQWVTIDSKWDASVPVLAKVGGVVPIGQSVQTLSPGDTENPAGLPRDDWRGVEIFPARAGGRWFEATWYEDDGVTLDGSVSAFTLRHSATDKEIKVDFEAKLGAGFRPFWTELEVVLPVGEKRGVVDKSGKPLASVGDGSRGRFKLEVSL